MEARHMSSLELSEVFLKGKYKEMFVAFIEGMLRWWPEDRKPAKELLQDSWLNTYSIYFNNGKYQPQSPILHVGSCVAVVLSLSPSSSGSAKLNGKIFPFLRILVGCTLTVPSIHVHYN
jgi:hypothetical protein